MRLMGDFLFPNGITALGVRLAGHATKVQDMARTRWRDWLASVKDGINILSQSCVNIFLVELLMGGALGFLAASTNQVDGIIAKSTPYEIASDWRIKFSKPISIFYPTIEKEANDLNNRDLAKAYIEYPFYPTRSIAELVYLLNHLHTQLIKINTPGLLTNSKSDHSVPISHIRKYQQLLASCKIETLILEKSRHIIQTTLKRNWFSTQV